VRVTRAISGQIDYDFVVAPAPIPRRIQFDVGGTKYVNRNKNGDLVLDTAESELRWHKPEIPVNCQSEC